MTIPFLDKACDLLGSQEALASVLGIKSPSISDWRKRKQVPAERCGAIEAATGGKVTRYDLRPDVFGEAPATELQEAG
ncbi:Cro/CI family transcriptional regulator [Rhodanobacter sp. BL-MT-08]